MTDTNVITRNEIKIAPPKMWRVILHNDDYTPFEFVQSILIQIYNKNKSEAYDITSQVHEKGKANVGVYTKEIATTKVEMTIKSASLFGFPLLVTIEEN